MDKITDKEKNFAKEYLNTKCNAAEAARRAYDIGSKGGSKTKEQADNTAQAIGSKELGKVGVQKEIQNLLTEDKLRKPDRIKKLGQIFYDEDKRSSIEANKEITKMLGEYEQVNRHSIEGSVVDEFKDILSNKEEENKESR